MAILGYAEVDIEKVDGHWSVREPLRLSEIFRIHFRWAFGDEYLNQSRDFQEALYTCVVYFPLTQNEKEEIFARFQNLRGRRMIGEEDESAGPTRVTQRRRIDAQPQVAPKTASPRAANGVKNRVIR